MNSKIPFGFLFEEPPLHSTESNLTPKYDPITGISYVVDNEGQSVPFVTFAFNTSGITNTGTFTKAQEDSEDTDQIEEDPRPKGLGTNTITEQKETTDRDFTSE